MKSISRLLILPCVLISTMFNAIGSSPNRKVQEETTIRSRISETYSAVFHISINANVAVISAEKVPAEAGDVYSAYLLNGASLSGGQVIIPQNAGTFWYIPFDFENQNPPVSVYAPNGANPVCYECGCIAATEGGGTGCEVVFDGSCAKCKEPVGCCTLSKVPCSGGSGAIGGALFVAANIIYFNDVEYIAQ